MRAVALDKQDLQICGECGRSFTAAVEMAFCPPCHVYMEFMVMYHAHLYQRWGVLPYV